MKPMLFACFVGLFSWTSLPAQNLILNSSFEEAMPPYSKSSEASILPERWRDLTRYWDTPTGGTPDIWLEKYRSDPFRNKGMKPLKPRTGESMIGIRAFGCFNIGGVHCREYIRTKTTETLTVGQCYRYEFFVLSSVSGVRINNLGLGFLEFKINDMKTCTPMDIVHKFQEEEIVHNGVGKWVKIGGEFSPETNYNYIIIGNFSNDKGTKTKKLDNGEKYAYYFIDDVKVYHIDCDSGEKIDAQKPYILSDVNFQKNSSKVAKEGRSYLDELYNKISTQNYKTIIVNGYTDNSGTDSHNLMLSQKRAESVMSILKKLGIPSDKMQAVGHGNSNSIDLKNKSRNRRVEIVVK